MYRPTVQHQIEALRWCPLGADGNLIISREDIRKSIWSRNAIETRDTADKPSEGGDGI
jgi:hypothetical protein